MADKENFRGAALASRSIYPLLVTRDNPRSVKLARARSAGSAPRHLSNAPTVFPSPDTQCIYKVHSSLAHARFPNLPHRENGRTQTTLRARTVTHLDGAYRDIYPASWILRSRGFRGNFSRDAPSRVSLAPRDKQSPSPSDEVESTMGESIAATIEGCRAAPRLRMKHTTR